MSAGRRIVVVDDVAHSVSALVAASLGRSEMQRTEVRQVVLASHVSGRERIFSCNSEAEIERSLKQILATYKGASTSTIKKLRKSAAARIRDLRAQAAAK